MGLLTFGGPGFTFTLFNRSRAVQIPRDRAAQFRHLHIFAIELVLELSGEVLPQTT